MQPGHFDQLVEQIGGALQRLVIKRTGSRLEREEVMGATDESLPSQVVADEELPQPDKTSGARACAPAKARPVLPALRSRSRRVMALGVGSFVGCFKGVLP